MEVYYLTDMQGKSRTDTVKVNGIYKETKDGTGDYTKEEQQYYPIRNDVDSDEQPEQTWLSAKKDPQQQLLQMSDIHL